ncbi:multiheme c-type cytochrome [Deferribacter desulfuricans SSM1]|uniref:Multiheme c-type cytochrome n=2 Tax=Deferribacter TaxID=53572 RepID=D3PC22_DEFDS|nr:multiheme c-type cytochrome [Deferribacter desulfuricans SSM1]
MVKKSIIVSLMILFINSYLALANNNCSKCHKNTHLNGKHRDIGCIPCHPKTEKHYSNIFTFNNNNCLNCHKEYENIKNSVMHTRIKEKYQVEKIFYKYDKNFFNKNCAKSCHINSCLDCHEYNTKKHDIDLPQTETCLKCHNGYFVGTDYVGLGIKDDHERYQIGKKLHDKYYLSMLKDIHYEKGLKCNNCHDMISLSKGDIATKRCNECHTINTDIIEHSINAHIEKMECYACHSSWAPMEFGTFFIQFINSKNKKYFRWLTEKNDEYVKSSYFITNSEPLLAKNKKDKYSPVRPQFIYFFTKIVNNVPVGKENKLLAANWKTFFPHTIRKETVLCANCHFNPKKYVLQKDKDRIFLPEKEGLELTNFYNSKNQNIINGKFVTEKEFNEKIKISTKKYKRLYLKKINELYNVLNLIDKNQ